MEIDYDPSFIRSYRKLSQNLRRRLAIREDLFRVDAFHPSLKTHKLKGAMSGLYSFSLDRRYRVVFKFITEREALFIVVGTHDIYE
jgi:mRNA-degrading endonuclease YafQ of YafQ-DinJ toxin-antitoxin module